MVDLVEGSWFQKCYDPDCRSYRSPLTPLPEDLRLSLQPVALRGRPGGREGEAGSRGAVPEGEVEEDDEGVMLEALQQYEQQQHRPPALGCSWADEPPDDDGLLLQALEQFEQRGAAAAAAAAAPTPPPPPMWQRLL